jgi:hypothetical protein
LLSILWTNFPDALTRRFRAPRTFDPSYSLLGRAFRWAIGDRLRSEALFLVTLTGLGLGLLMAHYLGWALLQTMTAADPSGTVQLYFWAGQVASVVLLVAAGGVGFRPGVTVTVDADTGWVRLEQGPRDAQLAVHTIDTVEPISARRFHMHERRYAATRVFAADTADTVLRLNTPEGPLVVALPDPDDLNALHEALTTVEHDEPVPVTPS